MKKEYLLNQAFLGGEFLNSAIETVQQKILFLKDAGIEVDPEFALSEFQAALNYAPNLAVGLSAKNFEVQEIHRQRKAIRKQLRKEGFAS